MGLIRDFIYRGISRGGLSVRLLKGYKRVGIDTILDIFNNLDKGLE
jgi:hypothetical protein